MLHIGTTKAGSRTRGGIVWHGGDSKRERSVEMIIPDHHPRARDDRQMAFVMQSGKS